MKTEALVAMLATGNGGGAPNPAPRRFAVAAGLGTLGAALLMVSLLGIRPDFASAVATPMFWVKLAFVGCVAGASLIAAARLSRPGEPLGRMPGMLTIPVVAVWIAAATILVDADPGQRKFMLLGETWSTCPWFIALLAIPAFVAMIWAMRGLAPTRLRVAGAAAGLVAGAIGALVYALHCTESTAPFLGTWYALGMLIPTAVGAVLGPRLLRW